MLGIGSSRRPCHRPAEGGRTDPLAEEAASLRVWEAEAHHDADDAEKVFADLSEGSCRDGEEATRVRKERDELL